MPLSVNNDAARNKFEAMKANFERVIIRSFLVAGEEAVRVARSNDKPHAVTTAKGDYTDRTGNLRNSTGYVLMRDTTPIGQAGDADAVALASDYAKQLTGKFRLVVVAGKDYASYVSHRGYDVLDSAEIECVKILKSLLHDLNIR